ncbi:MAG: PilN domain-containing protein [Sulfuritalea sp.]|jgi:type IV pilus assembly protein PilN|nr:PilN domain-containing protein [Sulfuritalea sp.]MBK8759704.1 PilN domain-containing protein [Sulfuritalea sp.]MBK9351177.1 PilN domain-containing protein [Sulfuritalea sp.]
MIRINLLPHREEKRKARRQQFYVMLGLVSVLAAVIWFLGFSIINREINVQNEKNEFLKREIASLDKEIAEIKKIQEQTNALLSRKRVIEALQANRTETVHLFNELAKQVPEGIYLRTLIQAGNKLTLTGVAQSNARITTLMNNLDESPLLEKSTLVETRSETINNRRLNAFSITTMITRQTSAPGKK